MSISLISKLVYLTFTPKMVEKDRKYCVVKIYKANMLGALPVVCLISTPAKEIQPKNDPDHCEAKHSVCNDTPEPLPDVGRMSAFVAVISWMGSGRGKAIGVVVLM